MACRKDKSREQSSENMHGSSHKEAVTSSFDHAAQEYFQKREHWYSFLAQKRIVLEMLDVNNGAKVLDIGCGPGVMETELLQRGYEVWGIDLSEKMLEYAAIKVKKNKFKHRLHLGIGDVEKLEFPDKFFDAVICMGVLEYLVTYQAAISEIYRTLQPGGTAIITVPTKISPYNLMATIFSQFCEWAKRLLRRSRDQMPKFKTNRCVPWSLNRELRGAGFSEIQCRYCNFIFFPLNKILPDFSLALNKRLERSSKSPLCGWMGTQYIVKSKKSI